MPLYSFQNSSWGARRRVTDKNLIILCFGIAIFDPVRYGRGLNAIGTRRNIYQKDKSDEMVLFEFSQQKKNGTFIVSKVTVLVKNLIEMIY